MTQNIIKMHDVKTDGVAAIAGRAVWAIVLMTLILGVAYPVVMTGIANVIFPHQATGSLIEENGKTVGSAIIGQDFTKTPYFQSRPSATSKPYDAAASTGSNWGASNEKLAAAVKDRAAYWTAKTGNPKVPADLLTASSSGLDPHISMDAALYQVDVVAANTGISKTMLIELINKHAERSLFGGPEFVNVLELNLDVAKAAGQLKK